MSARAFDFGDDVAELLRRMVVVQRNLSAANESIDLVLGQHIRPSAHSASAM